jgi:UrcA family protein
MKTFAIAAAAIGLACTTAPAFAAERQVSTMKVELYDLELGTAEGQKQLDSRIERAVRNVCRVTDPDTGSRILNKDARTCLAKARASAKSQVAAIMERQQRGV